MGSAIDYDTSALAHEDEGYHKGLKPRQLQMIAIGGAIGTGLFMGAGGRPNSAGPGLFIVYAVCGLFVFFILRALGELVLHRPSSGSFVSYAREFLGEKAAYVAGYWNLVAIVVIVPALIVGWYAVRGRVLEMARERIGYTGDYPVVAETPLMDELLDKDNRDGSD
jgi:L-asparagine transporter-like permease